MKRSILFIILMAFFPSLNYLFADNPIDLTKETPSPYPRILSLSLLPVEASYSDTELSIYFEASIGAATISITDESNQVVYSETVNTDTSSEIHVPLDLWTSGNYHLAITYSNTTLRGEFLLE